MGNTLRKYCPKCGYLIDPKEDRFCLSCGERIIQPDEEPALSDRDVKDIPIIEKTPVEQIREKNDTSRTKDNWLSGSYYIVIVALLLTLFMAVTNIINSLLLTLFMAVTNIINSLFLPLILVITLFGISLLGAFQMKMNKTYQGISFLKLLILAFMKFLSGRSDTTKPKNSNKITRK